MKHLRTISRTPQLAEDSSTDLSFILSILTLLSTLFTTFLGSFTTAFGGVLAAIGAYDAVKNPSGT
ncbi:MAG: hypothetical protein SGI88_00395 [Candidatus Hydrogenedentes bacterium]|nr:hypothetical protein [Candidatus Hydrogenedentota bacterium]